MASSFGPLAPRPSIEACAAIEPVVLVASLLPYTLSYNDDASPFRAALGRADFRAVGSTRHCAGVGLKPTSSIRVENGP